MTVVIDASVAVKLLFDDEGSASAQAYISQSLIAPQVFRLECANAVIRRLRLRQIRDGEAGFLLEEVKALPVKLHSASDAADAEAIRLAFAMRHPVQDCTYLALARAQRLQVVTADRRFLEATAAGYAVSVRLLGQP